MEITATNNYKNNSIIEELNIKCQEMYKDEDIYNNMQSKASEETLPHKNHNNNRNPENEEKEAKNILEEEKVEDDLINKSNAVFNSGCNNNIEEAAGSGSGENNNATCVEKPEEVKFLDIQTNENSETSEFDTDLLKYCVATGEIPIGVKRELYALERSYDTKPSYSKYSKFQEIASAENVEKILRAPPFDPQEPQVRFSIKRALSLNKISRSKDNVIQMLMPMECVEYIKSEAFNPMTEVLNTFAKHESDEFCTFCSCKECIAYREIAIHIMMEQFKSSHMIVLLLDAVMKAYSPLLRNATAFNGLEKLLENNKDIYWIASGLIYNKKYEHLDLIYDETLTDALILVLFSAILMVNNPMQLLQILSFYVKCIIKAFAIGICEVPADEKLLYIIDGFDHLCEISEQISTYLFAFEKYFLNQFSLTWVCLCQRLFHQHVYMKFFVAITNSGEGLRSDDPLKARYFDFAKRIICTDMRWNRTIWPKLQRYNLSEEERNRRRHMLHVHHLFDAVVEDALRLPLEESSDNNLFYDIHSLENRRLAWQNIMAFAKMRWPDGFFNAPNTLVLDFRCEKCGAINEQHECKCKCVTCSVGGDPFLPPTKSKNICLDCLLKQRKGNDDFDPAAESTTPSHKNEDEEIRELLCGLIGSKRSKDRSKLLTSNISKMGFLERFFEGDISDLTPDDPYHISWATFKHMSQRERYIHSTIEEKYFCKDCRIPACMLARNLLNNEFAPEITSHLITHFHPLPLHKHELRAVLPSVIYYNQRFCTIDNESSFHNVVVKAYWTFMVSLYTTYFYDFNPASPLNLSVFEMDQSDIKLIPERLTGNLEDTKFLEFLAIIRSFAPPDGCGDPAVIAAYLQREDIAQQLEGFLKIQEDRRKLLLITMFNSPQTMPADGLMTPTTPTENTIELTESSTSAVTVQPKALYAAKLEAIAPHAIDFQQRKAGNANVKPKKCCFEHSVDLPPEHCKDNHTGKKRIKKDCFHARINETRDRLRKKLLTARKYQQQQQQKQVQQLPPNIHEKSFAVTTNVQSSQEPTVRNIVETTSSENLYDDPECDSDNERSDSGSDTLLPTTPPPADELSIKTCEVNEEAEAANVPQAKFEKNEKTTTGKVIETCDIIDDNNKVNMKKWIDDTLTYIEGYASTSKSSQNGSINSNRKTQPQTKNPKKAAKKAKQKLRREEEKRISELHEIRAQFQDIYFKEFVEKIELKNLKSGVVTTTTGVNGGGGGGATKRRSDKKKIVEIEANIKKLQRAKAKLEGSILELIATVKQTNNEFKFPYLPTKEQQQEKLHEIEQAKLPQKFEKKSPKEPSTPEHAPKIEAQQLPSNTIRYEGGDNSLNYIPLPAKFLPNISFPYEMSFPGLGGVQGLSNRTTQSQQQKVGMCYTPPQQQMSSNSLAASGNNSPKAAMLSSAVDPSKRIVTIRRVHNPNLSDSQVTVTARGSSPNEDKLLYTFINGQLVQTNGTPTPDSEKSSSNSTTEAKGELKTLNKSQLKKERRRQAKLKLEQEEADRIAKETAQKARRAEEMQKLQKAKVLEGKKSKGNSKTSQELDKPVPPPPKSKKKANSKKAKHAEVIENKKAQQNPTKNKINPEKSSSKRNEVQKVKPSPKHEHSICKDSNSTAASDNNKAKKEAAREQRRLKLINHGQFDNNPYKTLHLQDSESELDITDSSYDEEEEDSVLDIIEVNSGAQKCEAISEKNPKLNKKQQQQPQQTAAYENTTKTAVQKKPNPQKQTLKSTEPVQQKNTSKSSVEVVDHRKNKNKPNGGTTTKPAENERLKKNFNEPKAQERGAKPRENTKRSEAGREQQINSVNGGTHYSERKKTTSYGNANNSRNTTAKVNQQNTGRNVENHNKSSSNRSSNAPKRDFNMPSSYSNDIKITSSRRSQRTRKKQNDQPNHQSHRSFTDCGIPAHMEHFNPNEVSLIPQQSQKQSQSQSHLGSLSHQFQGLQIAQDTRSSKSNLMPSYASVSANKSSSTSTVSIMDQLNRGVQVENLSLPPGITLTKVDPIKSEQLRQKSESIKRLTQPLPPTTTNNVPIMPTGFQAHGSTIIAPPVASYMPTQYISPSGAVPLDQGNIIMVESLSNSSSKEQKVSSNLSTAKAPSKNKRRRNKGKRSNEGNVAPDSMTSSSSITSRSEQQQPKMITLRNPMFHAGPSAAAASILQKPSLLTNNGFGAESGASSFSAPIPMDQPAAIIKNENGMYTIRNPALHQAVTNGLAISGYRQFGGNVSYYTPQEAVADATRATQQQQHQYQQKSLQKSAGPTESFSYFSNNLTNIPPMNIEGPRTVSAATSPTRPSNNISISCTSSDDIAKSGVYSQTENPRTSPIARPSSAQRCLSAIGSEMKTHRGWSEYRQQENLSNSHENLLSISETTLVGGNSNSTLDEKQHNPANAPSSLLHDKYQQRSIYYNDFEIFPSPNSNGSDHISSSDPKPPPLVLNSHAAAATPFNLPSTSSSMFDSTDAYMQHLAHHSCGDDSPPPTNLLGYSSSYLDDIPNTGVIRYDDASFLKNLIPGQRLNKEVSIHNINESNSRRNAASPMAHHVEITPVYSGNSNKNPQAQQEGNANVQQNFSSTNANYSSFGQQQTFNEFVDPNAFPNSSNNFLKPNNSVESKHITNISNFIERETKSFNMWDFDAPSQSSLYVTTKKISQMNSIFGFAAPSHKRASSSFLDETTMDGFVQNLNSLHIGGSTKQQQQPVVVDSGRESDFLGNTNKSNPTNSRLSGAGGGGSGWW